MKFLSALLGLAPAVVASPSAAPPPAIIAPPPNVSAPIQIEREAPRLIMRETPAAHPACEALDAMVAAFNKGLAAHGCERTAMADALTALRFVDIRAPEITGPGNRRASAKAQRRFRAVLDAMIINGAGAAVGWEATDGQAFG